jgi:hypothetical protein
MGADDPISLPSDAPRPDISLHLLVKNGASVVGRLIACVGPYLREVVAVLNDCTDDTREVLEAACAGLGVECRTISVTSASHPHLYALDVPSTYEVGRALVGEEYEGPYTGGPMLIDWAGARNVGWDACVSKWRLFLDADDVVDDPHCLPGLCQILDERGLDAAASTYHPHHDDQGRSLAEGARERIARGSAGTRWTGCVHEHLTGAGAGKIVRVVGSLVVRDLRDSRGEGTRIPDRNLKVLYYHARRQNWQISPREMVYLACEARRSMPALSMRLVELQLTLSRWREERAWAASIAGEICERRGDYAEASAWYERSLEEYPSVGAACLLARSRYLQRSWQESYDAYERARANRGVPQHLGWAAGITLDQARTFAATSLKMIGRIGEAAELIGGGA